MTRYAGPALAFAALALHLATASRYGYFRDELYFIECARHLAWGYVDQPPLVAFAAWIATPFGDALLSLRFLPALAASATVLVVAALTAELGGRSFARWIAGILALLTPAYLLLGNTLTTTSFEPLTWTLTIYCAVKMVRTEERRWWLALALVIAFGLYGKYSIALLVAALVVGLLLTPQRRTLRSPWAALCAALVALLIAPNLAWQAAHGWPFVDVLRGDALHRPAFQNGLFLQYRSLAANAAAFVVEQALYTNPLAVPIWVAGIVALSTAPAFRQLRFIAIATILTLLAAVAMGAKGYYVIGLYGSLLAAGCVWLERQTLAVRTTLAAAAVAVGIAAMPLGLPLLPVNALVAYTQTLHLSGNAPGRLVQPVFAEEFGWDRLARDVARVYHSLSPKQRAMTTLYADTYADAGALDFFGPRYGLPHAVSTQNSYYLWGPGPGDGRMLIAVGATRIDDVRRFYRSVRLVATSFDPLRWIVEGPAPIYLCTDPVAPLARIWPRLRWYGA